MLACNRRVAPVHAEFHRSDCRGGVQLYTVPGSRKTVVTTVRLKSRTQVERCTKWRCTTSASLEEQAPSFTLTPVGQLLLSCGDEIVAAASVLGENQKLAENPGSLSGAGCALANSGRALLSATEFTSRLDGSNGDWDTHLSAAAEEISAGEPSINTSQE